MGKILIVSKANNIDEYKKISEEFNMGFEYNDFYVPDVLDSQECIEKIVNKYISSKIPEYCTLHGAFFDVIIFSQDREIRKISEKRMEQSMEIARRIGAKAVIFHTNYNPFLNQQKYDDKMVSGTVKYMKYLLEKYSDINIYMENMFDKTPDILRRISDELAQYENYGVCLDYAHASISGTSMDVWVEELKKYIRHFHINDNNLQKDEHLAIGEGKIDWGKFLETYDQYFTDCSVLIETTEPENQRKSIEYLQKLGFLK